MNVFAVSLKEPFKVKYSDAVVLVAVTGRKLDQSLKRELSKRSEGVIVTKF